MSASSGRPAALLRRPKDRLLYMYDFGDDWDHTIELEAVTIMRYPPKHLG